MDAVVKRDLKILIVLAVAMKIVAVLLTVGVFHSFIDFWDYSYYYDGLSKLSAGQIPYLDFQFDYPILAWLPLVTAYTFSSSPQMFSFVLELIMLVFDILTIYGIYRIGMLVWVSRTRAFTAGVLYALSLPVAYFTLVRLDPFPVCIMVWAVVVTLERQAFKGYVVSFFGFLVKVFPVILVPFFVIWNSKGGDFKKEVWSAAKIAPLFIIPFVVLAGSVTERLSGSGVVMANTPTYLLHMYLFNILHLPIPIGDLSLFMYALAASALLLLANAFLRAKKNPVILLTTLMLAIFVIVFCSKLHSPQFIMWYLPFLCLLVADDIELIGLLFIVQILAYVEFPLLFGSYYNNAEYLHAVYSGGWWFTLAFFTLEYFAIFWLLIAVINKHKFSFSISPY